MTTTVVEIGVIVTLIREVSEFYVRIIRAFRRK